VADLFHGTAGKSFYGWYCDFSVVGSVR
jgi:hypothetical protein